MSYFILFAFSTPFQRALLFMLPSCTATIGICCVSYRRDTLTLQVEARLKAFLPHGQKIVKRRALLQPTCTTTLPILRTAGAPFRPWATLTPKQAVTSSSSNLALLWSFLLAPRSSFRPPQLLTAMFLFAKAKPERRSCTLRRLVSLGG